MGFTNQGGEVVRSLADHTGAAGTVITVGGAVMGHLAQVASVLQVISYVVTITAGVFTIAWYLHRFKKGD